jgi:hypothetical protein
MTAPRAPYRGELALYRAADTSSCSVGLCLRYTRQYYDIPARYASAYSAWRNMDPDRRHQSYPPPRGVPVFWSGGSQSFGHIAISLGGGYVRSTDWPSAGRVSNAKISDISARWYMTYLGWGYDLNGYSVWAPTVDASAVYYCATHSPHRHASVKPVEESLHARGYLPAFRVNTAWNGYTANAYKQWEKRLSLTQNGRPGLSDLRRLGRLKPYMIVKP